jgi:nitroreductase
VQRLPHELEPWNVSEDAFPKDGSMLGKLKFFLKYAILAPSSRNTQPWNFKILNDNTIELYADRSRALPVVDPRGRELTISCGAALGYLQITIRHFGYKYKTEVLSSYEEKKKDEHLLARIIVYDYSGSDDDTANIQENNIEVNSLQVDDNNRLFEAITTRRTNRFRFEDRNIPDILLAGFYYIVDKYPQYQKQQKHQENSIWLHIADEDDEKNALAELIVQGDRIQLSDKRFRRELVSCIHLNRSRRRRSDIPRYASGISNFMSMISPFIIKTFNINKKQAEKDRELAATSPVLAVLGSHSDEPLDWINTGMALANILLLASSENVCCSFLNQPIQISQLRPKLLDAISKNKGFPQVLLRMGYSSERIRPSPRRNVEEVLW